MRQIKFPTYPNLDTQHILYQIAMNEQAKIKSTDDMIKLLAEKWPAKLLEKRPTAFQYKEIYSWPESPSISPWPLSNTDSLTHAIQTLFEPLTDHLPKTIALVQARCENLFVLRLQNDQWLLLFILQAFDQERCSYSYLLGAGQPASSPQLSSELIQDNWTIPQSLKSFYAVFNGFGSIDLPWQIIPFDCILPDTELLKIEASWDAQPKHALLFYPDGAGNGQCFCQPSQDTDVDITFDWDHETEEFSRPMPFWEFMDQQLSQIDNEWFD